MVFRVNSVSPGWIWSPEVAKAAGEGGRERWEPVWGKFHISNRLGDIAEVAAAVTFLASNDAAFINATDLKVVLQAIIVLYPDLLRLMVAMGQ